jgi:hypothetical protein
MDDKNKTLPFVREIMISVLVYHQPTNTSGCHCGWGELGRSHPEHVVEIYEMSITRR